MTNKLIVSEIFYSIQGEGPNVGKPAVFLRLAGCNLRCEWCDSKYAITITKTKTSNSLSNSLSYSNSCNQVVKQIRQFPCKHLVITGGEPLLQQGELLGLLKQLKGYFVEVETNGSIALKIAKYVEHINCSPKLSNSGNKPYALKIKPANKKVIYKFVVSAGAHLRQGFGARLRDINEIKRFIRANKIPKNRVWLMPEGVDREKIIERSKWIIEICKKEGFNFSPRLHIMLGVR
jgi:7-carboxy-7-deazaguanine synthase